MDDQTTPSAPVDDATTSPPANSSNSAPTPVEPDSDQSIGSDTANTPPMAPESPINADSNTPVEDQNQGVNQPESEAPEEPISAPNEPEAPVNDQPISANDNSAESEPVPISPVQVASPAPTPLTPIAPQAQPSAQPLQAPTPITQPNSSESLQFRSIQARGRTKIQTNREEKLDKLIQFAQKKQIIDNEEIQMLLHISSATATRYLEALVKQGRLVSEGSPRHAKYRFVR